MSDKKNCDCDQPAAITINVTKASGELIEQVHLCKDCALHGRSVAAFEQLGIRIDESLIS